MDIALHPATAWSDDPNPDQDPYLCTGCQNVVCTCPDGSDAQYVCVGCENCFALRDLFVINGDDEAKEMRCLACFHARILKDNGGHGPSLALFHEMVGGPAHEQVMERA